MSTAGSPPRGRVAALALLGVLIAAVWVGPVNAYLDFIGAAADQISTQVELLRRYRAIVDRPAGEPKPAGGIPTMLPESPEAQAVALLQETVKNAAVASRLQIQSVQVLRSESLPGAIRIGIRIRRLSRRNPPRFAGVSICV